MSQNQKQELPFVSILIPVRNVARYIEDCLSALLNQNYPRDKYEILILDNNSNDGTIEIISRYAEPVKLLQMGVDSPPIKYNLALDKTKGDIIALVDGDANVHKDWLRKVVEPLSDPKVAGAAGIMLTANKDKIVPRTIGYDIQDRQERMPRKIKRAQTTLVVYKKDVLKEVDGFDETLKTGYDCEIGHRVNDAGYDLIFVLDAKVYHHHRTSLWAFFKQEFEYGEFALLRYLKKPKTAKGDELVELSLITQPLFYLVSLLLLPVAAFTGTSYKWAIIPVAILFGRYIYSAIRVARKYREASALFLVVIYFIRPVAATLGAIRMILRLIFGRRALQEV